MGNTAALNNDSLRERNRGLVFKLIATNDGISRTEIAQQSGLTKMAVTYIISEFLQRNLVVETEYTGERKLARKPIMLRLSPSAPRVVTDAPFFTVYFCANFRLISHLLRGLPP